MKFRLSTQHFHKGNKWTVLFAACTLFYEKLHKLFSVQEKKKNPHLPLFVLQALCKCTDFFKTMCTTAGETVLKVIYFAKASSYTFFLIYPMNIKYHILKPCVLKNENNIKHEQKRKKISLLLLLLFLLWMSFNNEDQTAKHVWHIQLCELFALNSNHV